MSGAVVGVTLPLRVTMHTPDGWKSKGRWSSHG